MHSAFFMRLASPQTSPDAGTIFGTTDVYELGFTYLSIIFLLASLVKSPQSNIATYKTNAVKLVFGILLQQSGIFVT